MNAVNFPSLKSHRKEPIQVVPPTGALNLYPLGNTVYRKHGLFLGKKFCGLGSTSFYSSTELIGC